MFVLNDDIPYDLENALWELEQAWKVGIAEVSDFAPPPDHPARRSALLALIHLDKDYRWRRSGSDADKKKIEWYLEEKFPELQGDRQALLELVRSECLIRAELKDRVTAEELKARFPEICDQIDLAKIEARARQESRGKPGGTEAWDMAATPGNGLDSTGSEVKPTVRSPLEPGQQFGRYTILKLLGDGGMAWVYLAKDNQLPREVALKVPKTGPSTPPEILTRFVQESQVVAQVDHRNICPIFDAGEIGGIYYIVLKYIRGPVMSLWLKGREVSPREAAGITCKLARALGKVHDKGIVHRDIKPHNVMMDEDDEPMLMDFGLARPIERDTMLTISGGLLGTPWYMSPEQVRCEEVDRRTDIWSLGVVLFEMLTGRVPFDAPMPKVLAQIEGAPVPKPRKICPAVDHHIQLICLKALTKELANRYQSAVELADALQRYLDGLPAPPRRLVRRGPVFGWQLAVVISTLSLLLAAGIYFGTRRNEPIARNDLPMPAVQPANRATPALPQDRNVQSVKPAHTTDERNLQISLVHTFNDPAGPGKKTGFGHWLAINDDKVVIGSVYEEAAYLFSASNGELVKKFKNGVPGSGFGGSVAVGSDWILVGSDGDDTRGQDAGAAYLYRFNGIEWDRPIVLYGTTAGDFFGSAVATLGDNVLVGAPQCETGAGRAYLIDTHTGSRLKTFTNPRGEKGKGSYFGRMVASAGGNVVIGAPHDDTDAPKAGLAYMFDGRTGDLLRTFHNPRGAAGEGDLFGFVHSLAVSGSKIAIGAHFHEQPVAVFDLNTGQALPPLKPPPSGQAVVPAGTDPWFGKVVAANERYFFVSAYKGEQVYAYSAKSGEYLQAIGPKWDSPGGSYGHCLAATADRLLVAAFEPRTDVPKVYLLRIEP